MKTYIEIGSWAVAALLFLAIMWLIGTGRLLS